MPGTNVVSILGSSTVKPADPKLPLTVVQKLADTINARMNPLQTADYQGHTYEVAQNAGGEVVLKNPWDPSAMPVVAALADVHMNDAPVPQGIDQFGTASITNFPLRIQKDNKGFDVVSGFKIPLRDLLGTDAPAEIVFAVRGQMKAPDGKVTEDLMRLYDAKGIELAAGQKGEATRPTQYEFDLRYSEAPIKVVVPKKVFVTPVSVGGGGGFASDGSTTAAGFVAKDATKPNASAGSPLNIRLPAPATPAAEPTIAVSKQSLDFLATADQDIIDLMGVLSDDSKLSAKDLEGVATKLEQAMSDISEIKSQILNYTGPGDAAHVELLGQVETLADTASRKLEQAASLAHDAVEARLVEEGGGKPAFSAHDILNMNENDQQGVIVSMELALGAIIPLRQKTAPKEAQGDA